jgi:hypothetical protein
MIKAHAGGGLFVEPFCAVIAFSAEHRYFHQTMGFFIPTIEPLTDFLAIVTPSVWTRIVRLPETVETAPSSSN